MIGSIIEPKMDEYIQGKSILKVNETTKHSEIIENKNTILNHICSSPKKVTNTNSLKNKNSISTYTVCVLQ
jgi:hypothetical protein